MTNELLNLFGESQQAVCGECFLEREGKKGCICYSTKEEGFGFCSICDEVHARSRICQKCTEKQTTRYKNIQTFLKVVLPTTIISLIIGFFLGWLLLVKLRRKKDIS